MMHTHTEQVLFGLGFLLFILLVIFIYALIEVIKCLNNVKRLNKEIHQAQKDLKRELKQYKIKDLSYYTNQYDIIEKHLKRMDKDESVQ